MKRIIALAAVLGCAAAMTAAAADGAALWKEKCAKCHGEGGKGDTKMGQKLGIRDYTDAKVQESLKDEEMVKAIKEGVHKDGKTVMKATEGLSDDEVKALVAHIRGFKK